MSDEQAIITRVLDGETEAFRLLVQRYQGPVIRMVANLTGRWDGGEDVAQDAFLAAFRALGSFDPARSTFATWLFTIARNKALNAVARRRTLSADAAPEPSQATKPDRAMAGREFFVALDRGLASLPVSQRAAFVLVEIEELSYEAVAQIEGVRIGTVKSRVSRAKESLRRILSQFGDRT